MVVIHNLCAYDIPFVFILKNCNFLLLLCFCKSAFGAIVKTKRNNLVTVIEILFEVICQFYFGIFDEHILEANLPLIRLCYETINIPRRLRAREDNGTFAPENSEPLQTAEQSYLQRGEKFRP